MLLDNDVFGDGTVMMLGMPGHTPGHTSLLVKLQQKGNVLLSGDLAHFHENYESNGVPTFNTSRAESRLRLTASIRSQRISKPPAGEWSSRQLAA